MSYNVLGDATVAGKTFFDMFEFATDKVLIPVAGLVSVIFFAWFINHNNVLNELDLHFTKRKLFSVTAKFIAPIIIVLILLTGLFG
jgi:NSS family neurotransmitter:Na+ symporter